MASPGIPIRLSTFVGRRRELTELRRLTAHTRLLSIIGPGGSGKTRLALELARRIAGRFPDGTVWIDLSDVRAPGEVEEVVARAAGETMRGGGGVDAFRLQLRDRRTLILLDNCEQVVEGAGRVAASLLLEFPQLAIVATSRERLNIDGELSYSVPPLTLPTEGRQAREADSDALRLFVNRARQVRPDFMLDAAGVDAVAAICHRLDGMPLAIELAAARMLTMTPADLLPRLEGRLGLLVGGARNRADRQHTLRATLDWSYELLSGTERLLLRRISVLNGERDLSTIASVCGAPPLNGPALAVNLGRLVDKSMVQARPEGDTMVYRLLQTVREYSASKLADTGEEVEISTRHLAHYRTMAAAAFATRQVRGGLPEQRRLWREIDDVRAALDLAQADPATAVEMLGHLGSIWLIYAPDEGRRRIAAALHAARHLPESTWWRAAEVYLALSGRTGDHSKTELYTQVVQRQAQATGDTYAQGRVLEGAAFTAERRDRDLVEASRLMVAAAVMLQRVPAGPDLVLTLQSLGSIERQLGNLEAARATIERSIALAREVQDPYDEIGALFHLGWWELDHGAPGKAIEAFAAGLDLAEDSDLLSIAHEVEGVAAALATTEPATAARLLGSAASLRKVLNSPLHAPWLERMTRAIAQIRASLGDADWDRAMAAAGPLTSPRRLREMVDLVRRPSPAARSGRAERPAIGGLSRREVEVSRLVAEGLSNRAIAEKLFLSERTVHSHLAHILNKLGFGSRAQLASWVTERQL